MLLYHMLQTGNESLENWLTSGTYKYGIFHTKVIMAAILFFQQTLSCASSVNIGRIFF